MLAQYQNSLPMSSNFESKNLFLYITCSVKRLQQYVNRQTEIGKEALKKYWMKSYTFNTKIRGN